MELWRAGHVVSSASLFLALTLTMTTQALLPCDVICSQGIPTTDCDCDVTMQQQHTADTDDLEKRSANDEYMYNKIFKWGKRKFNNPFSSTGERIMPIDNIDRRIFRWGKRSGNRAESRIFRWGKRSDVDQSLLDQTMDQSMLSALDDGQVSSHAMVAPPVKRGFTFPYTTYGGRLGALRSDLRKLLVNTQSVKESQDKRITDAEAMRNRIFRFGKRANDEQVPYRTGNKREERDKLRKIFMWG